MTGRQLISGRWNGITKQTINFKKLMYVHINVCRYSYIHIVCLVCKRAKYLFTNYLVHLTEIISWKFLKTNGLNTFAHREKTK